MPAAVDPLRSFELRAWARAYMLQHGFFVDEAAAFEPLWTDACDRDGLVAKYGGLVLMDIIQAAIAATARPQDPA